jgi:hypothetical protein
MAIIVGDIHGNVEKVQAFLAYKPDVEHVALGDYLDSFHEPLERQFEALRLLMESDAVLLLGNHDVHYLDDPLFRFPGFQVVLADTVKSLLEGNISRFRAAYVADGWLCTHAGGHSTIIKGLSEKELEGLFCVAWDSNVENRGRGFLYQSIFRFDFIGEGTFSPDSIKQVVAHDHHRDAGFVNQNCVAVGCSDKGTCWVFDTETNEVLDLGRVR